MKILDLREEERAELEALVTSRMADLLMEIAGTNSFALREALTCRAILLKEMLDNLGHPEAEPEAS